MKRITLGMRLVLAVILLAACSQKPAALTSGVEPGAATPTPATTSDTAAINGGRVFAPISSWFATPQMPIKISSISEKGDKLEYETYSGPTGKLSKAEADSLRNEMRRDGQWARERLKK